MKILETYQYNAGDGPVVLIEEGFRLSMKR